MIDTRRDQLIEIVERELIGPDPIDWPGLTQENGEEILVSDPPRTRYIAGILFPQNVLEEETDLEEGEAVEGTEESGGDEEIKDIKNDETGDEYEFLEDAEELINLSNAYKQSAISVTAAVKDGDTLKIDVSAGVYNTSAHIDLKTNKDMKKYLRTQISWTNNGQPLSMPSASEILKQIDIDETHLRFSVTYRYRKGNFSIYTFTLENSNTKTGTTILDEDCYFQVKFRIFSAMGFCPLPDSQRINTDEDYWSNQLLYRNIRNYAIGHGCAADWDESGKNVSWISTSIFPEYEIKPIIPSSIAGVSLEMLKMSDVGDFNETVKELKLMCDKYQEWINQLKIEAANIEDKYKQTAEEHIIKCETCLERMENGIEILEHDATVRTAFQYMNRAMLLQQLRYNLPLQRWIDDGSGGIKLENPIRQLPVIKDSSTWYDKENRTYGKWRPFQIAFILINLKSMYDKDCGERDIVDLIWFPTGGGKTEAYLGLSAYTIFIRKLKNKDDAGTAILMRYTLRLLTAQQYERAAAMICACDIIRSEHEETLGTARISIGLWVGGSTTPNSMSEAVGAYEKLYNGTGDINPFVLLKCPWCGAQMGVVLLNNNKRILPGYKKIVGPHNRKSIIFQCSNSEYGCEFASANYSLPLFVVDDIIYEKTPTLLLGTVDKFAMLPFRPQAQRLFGYQNGEKRFSSPDLIIQDELHLISGPLGSMVGHYEILINELCTQRTTTGEIRPKIIASTATISRAKEQCHALYGCGRENVFQFPPSGLNAGDSFFAKEDQEGNGRKYVGILASGSSSDTTTAIRLFSALLYGAKALEVDAEEMRDPYWTNVGYFNSIRELGQAATWIRSDIDQHLDVMYKRRFDEKRYENKEEYQKRRRYIRRDEELTSRIRSDKVTASLENLSITYPPEINDDGKIKEHPLDICLATNMISVGLDVQRLGLMTVAGQPKTTSEYIQATSRVGRNADKAPGIVFVLYRPGRPRDKSHYEQFRAFHSRVYCNVEPTSVTPFSAPLRERALHAVMIGIMRLQGNKEFNDDPPKLPDRLTYEGIRTIIENRVKAIDSEETDATIDQFDHVIQRWGDWQPQKFQDFISGNELPLMFPAGMRRNEAWGEKRGFETPTSMRNVDASCEVYVLENRYIAEGR